MATASDLSIGSVIRYNNDLYVITEYQHRTPGNLRAFYQAKMKNVKSGKSAESRFRTGEEVEIVRLEYKALQYIYSENENLVCMDNDTYEQTYIPEHLFGESNKFLKEGMEVKIAFEGDMPIIAEAPTFVDLTVTYAEPGMKGDTATNTLKPAKLETGAEINIPLFVNQGEMIRVDTRTGNYVERVK